MYKFFRNFGFFLIILCSFFYSKKIVNVVKENDEIMLKIKENNNIEVIDGIIGGDTIIPGVCGKKINIEKSYSIMRQYGRYDQNLLVYDNIKPYNSLKKIYNKYIIRGNELKKQVSLLIIINNTDDIKKYIELVKKNKIVVNYFLKLYDKNIKKTIIDLAEENNIGIYEIDNYVNYNKIDNLIKKLIHQKQGYCYVEKSNKNILNICSKNKNYTILPNIIVKDNLINLKKNITNGSIIAIKKYDENMLNLMIDYIKKKGYEIVDLNTIIKEC